MESMVWILMWYKYSSKSNISDYKYEPGYFITKATIESNVSLDL